MPRSRAFVLAIWLIVSMVWGTSWGTIKVGLRDLPFFTFSASRTVLAAIALTLVAQLTQGRRRPAGKEFWFWSAVGLLQLAVPYGIVFWAETMLPSAVTAMLIGTYPAFTAILAHYLLPDEPLSVVKILAAVVAVSAVAVLVGVDGFSSGTFWPVTGVLFAALASALGSVLLKRHGTDVSTLWLTTLQVGSSAVVLAILAVVLEWNSTPHWTPTAVTAVFYLGLVVTVLCFSGLFWLLKNMDTTQVSMMVVIETSVAVLVGKAALDEPLGPRILVGLALVVVSVLLVLPRRATRQAQLAPHPPP